MSKILSLFLIALFLLTLPSRVSAQNCTIEMIPSSLFENIAPLTTSVPEEKRWIQFKITPQDKSSKYKLVFPRTWPSPDEVRDNLTYNETYNTLMDQPNTYPGLQFKTGSDVLFKPEEKHNFYLERQGTPGKYCEGSYIINRRPAGTLEQCQLNIPSADEQTDISFEGTVKPTDGDYRLSITGAATETVDFKVDANGNTPLIQVGRLNPGAYIFTVQRRTPDVSVFYNTTCQYNVTIAQTGKQGSVAKTGINSSTTNQCKGDDPKCSKAGGDPCGTDDNPGFKTAIGCIHSTPAGFVKDFLTFAVGIGGGLAFMMMLFGAFQMMTSGGNPQNLAGGKDVLQNAIIGLLFIIFSILLMKIIGIDILAIPGFT